MDLVDCIGHYQLNVSGYFHTAYLFVLYNYIFLIYFEQVVAYGLWLAPGDSEEVAAALSQALRNCIER